VVGGGLVVAAEGGACGGRGGGGQCVYVCVIGRAGKTLAGSTYNLVPIKVHQAFVLQTRVQHV
jgi:hypothetical protein